MPRRKSKKESEMKHLKRRWISRVGEEMNKQLHGKIVEAIQLGNSKVVERQSNRVTIHKITLDKEPLTVVYDRLRKQVVTVLPKESNNEITN